MENQKKNQIRHLASNNLFNTNLQQSNKNNHPTREYNNKKRGKKMIKIHNIRIIMHKIVNIKILHNSHLNNTHLNSHHSRKNLFKIELCTGHTSNKSQVKVNNTINKSNLIPINKLVGLMVLIMEAMYMRKEGSRVKDIMHTQVKSINRTDLLARDKGIIHMPNI